MKYSILDVWQGSGDALWAGWSMIFQLIDKVSKAKWWITNFGYIIFWFPYFANDCLHYIIVFRG